MLNLVCFASGAGSNFETIIQSCKTGILKGKAQVILLITNVQNAGCLDRAQRLNIPSKTIISKGFNGSREEYDEHFKSNNKVFLGC